MGKANNAAKKQDTEFKENSLYKEKPKVLLSAEAMAKIRYWVNISSVEISGLGKCYYDKRRHAFIVNDAWLLEQENGPTTTDIDASAAAKLLYETREVEGHLNFWWHSHVNMGVFWSGTDTSTIQEFGEQGICVATVFNKKGEMRSAFYQGGNGEDKFLPAVFVDELPTGLVPTEIPDSKIQAWNEEFRNKCKTKTYNYNGYYGNTTHNTGNTYNQALPHQIKKTKLSSQERAMIASDPSTYLGFETSHTTGFKLLKVFDGVETYSGQTFVTPETMQIVKRESGMINSRSYTLWDTTCNGFRIPKTFFDNNKKEDYVFLQPPFTMNDFDNICKLYKLIFKHPPVYLDDIQEFFCDFMDVHWGETIGEPWTAAQVKEVRNEIAFIAAQFVS